jgi:hypothetical protein
MTTDNEQESTEGSGRPITNYSSYCEGDRDPTLNKRIHTLIDSTDDYIVYLDDDFFVEWSTTREYGETLPAGIGNVLNRSGHLETRSISQLRPLQVLPFRRLLAEAVARVVGDKDEAGAQQVLDRAEAYLSARGQENARWWYLQGSLSVAACNLAAVGILWLLKPIVTQHIGVTAFEILLGALLGGPGALVSILNRSSAIGIDPSAGAFIHTVEGAARIVVGTVGALLVALAIKADVLLGLVKSLNHSLAALLALCMAAGASERLATNLISSVEDSVGKAKKGAT